MKIKVVIQHVHTSHIEVEVEVADIEDVTEEEIEEARDEAIVKFQAGNRETEYSHTLPSESWTVVAPSGEIIEQGVNG